MKTSVLIFIISTVVIGNTMAERAIATFKTTTDGEKIQVIINNKVMNRQKKPTVKVQGRGGYYEVKIKVFRGHRMMMLRKKVHIQAGYKNEFTLLEVDNKIQLRKTGISRIYKSRYRRPDQFYNKRYLASGTTGNYEDPCSVSTIWPTSDSGRFSCSLVSSITC